MRIALIGTRGVPAQYGGFETAAEEIGQRLVVLGHDVVVYCRNPGQRITEHRGMQLVNLPAVRAKAAETLTHTALSVAHAVTRDRPDVAIVFNAANAPLLPVLRRAGVPVAMHVDGLEWERAKWGRVAVRYYLWAEARAARWADAVIADARGIADRLERVHGVTATYIPYGAPIVSPGPQRLVELNLEPRGYHLVVARFEPENHVREMVAGYASSGCQLPLIVVGDAPYAAAYSAQVRAAAADDPRVRFVGSIWDPDLLDTLYAHCATYLHGHSVGGTNPSLLRAMGAGAPVIAYDVVFNREVAAGAGRWFRTPEELGRACERAESEPVATAQRGSAGRADVAERYRWDDVAASYEALAEQLLAATPRRVSTRRGRRSRPSPS